MVQESFGTSIAPRTEYVHTRVRCPRCGASVRADRTGTDAGRCANCRTAR